MRIYTDERVAQMSHKERQASIEAVKTSNTLTPKEKEANLMKLETPNREMMVLRQIQEGAADISDINQ